MNDLNGFQLHQQIKSIDPTIKILFVTILDISDEILTIVPGISKEQILIKPVDKKLFTNTVKKTVKVIKNFILLLSLLRYTVNLKYYLLYYYNNRLLFLHRYRYYSLL